ncbi:MAG: flagellar basal-body MS-ring/collar protein FliF [Candidatus Hydrogenedentota bacterium]
MEFLRQLAEGIVQAWQRLSLSARINLVLASVATMAVVAAVVFLTGRAQYVELYSGLTAEDSAAIQSALSDEGVSYRLRNGGSTIMAPARERSRLRVTLMEEDLPQAYGEAPGFEIFDQQELLASRYLQDVNYMRAIQGELQRHLNQFDFVRRSFVFISETEDELFVTEQQPSQAAVTIDTTRPLTAREVQAVVRTIASYGGARLTRQNIALSTTTGELLHRPHEEEFAATANSQLEFIDALERQREEKARKALESMGVRSIIRVSADVDFSSGTEQITEVEEGALLSSMVNETTMTSTQNLPEGPPGAVANLPDEDMAEGGTETEETTEEIVENFEPGKRVQQIQRPPGSIESYQVSAFIEGNREPELDENGEPTGDMEYVPLEDDEIERYQDFIAASVGVDAGNISVYDHPFRIDELGDARAAMEEIETANLREMLLTYGMNVLTLVIIVIGFFVVRRLLRRASVSHEEESEQAAAEGPTLSTEEQRRRQMAADVEQASQQNPEAVAALLRTWISESEE